MITSSWTRIGLSATVMALLLGVTAGCSSDNGSTNPQSPTAGPGGAGWAKYSSDGSAPTGATGITDTKAPGEPPVVGSHPGKASSGDAMKKKPVSAAAPLPPKESSNH